MANLQKIAVPSYVIELQKIQERMNSQINPMMSIVAEFQKTINL